MSDLSKIDCNEVDNENIIKELADVKNKAFTLLMIMIPTLTLTFGFSLTQDGSIKKFISYISFILSFGLIFPFIVTFISKKNYKVNRSLKNYFSNDCFKKLTLCTILFNLSMTIFLIGDIIITIVSFINC